MSFPVCTIEAGERLAKHKRLVALFANSGMKVEPEAVVLMHGKSGELLGTWRGDGYAYAAVRFPWHGRYEYALFHPDFVRTA